MTLVLNVGEYHLEYHIQPGNGPAALFLNGGHTSALSPACCQWFIEHDWTVIMVLRPERNGDSEAALCRLLDELTAEWPKIASATVVVISAGGRAATRFVELYPERVNTLLLVSLVSLASWSSTPTRIAVHILFNPLVKQATWALTRGLLRRYLESSLTQLIALFATLLAKKSCREYQKTRGRSMCISLPLYDHNKASSKTFTEKHEHAIHRLLLARP